MIRSLFVCRAIVIWLLVTLGYRFGWAQSTIRIACVGNSITFGAGIEDREHNSYPAQLAHLLGPAYEVGNFGRSGATLLRKGNIPFMEQEAYQQALQFQPQWVFIKLGTNDTKPTNRPFLPELVQDYKALITSFQQLATRPRVVLLLPVPVFSTDTTDITARVLEQQIIPAVRQVAYETNCDVLNLYNLLIDAPQFFPDKIHPDAAGALVMAQRIADFVRQKRDPDFDIHRQWNPEGTPFNFYGFRGLDIPFMNRNAKIVCPRQAAVGHPWIWRARFWAHEPQADIALLERGFHVVYCDVAELFGNDEAMSIWDGFYQRLTQAGLAPRAVMEGMSRGGVYIYRWAARYPDRVAAVYADAPVLDLKSWPGGKGVGKASPTDWEKVKTVFGLPSEQAAMAFQGNPLDLVAEMVKGRYPMLHVVGDADEVVPVAENTTPFAAKVKAMGGTIEVIHKPGVKHHPHSLPNPKPIVDFILRATGQLNTE